MDEEELQEIASDDVPTEDTASEQADDKSISSDLIRGHINTIILRALYDGDKYGYEIIAEIEQKSHGQYSIKQPSLYSALKRLEREEFISSYWGGSVSGGRRKYFSLTEKGREISERNQAEWEYSRTVIDSLISDKDFDFSTPPPTAVDMRVLKGSTTRVSGGREVEGDEETETPKTDEFLAQERLAFEEERARSREELEEGRRRLEEEREQLALLTQKQEEERARYQEEQARLEEERAELQAQISQEDADRVERTRQHAEELERQRLESEERMREQEQALEQERAQIVRLQAERATYMQQAQEERERALAEQESQLRAEAERQLAEREQEIRHQNYLNLVSNSSGESATHAPLPPIQEQAQQAPASPPPPPSPAPAQEGYRGAVQQIMAGTVQTSESAPRAPVSRSGRIDFSDLEERATQDGIRITTSGEKKQEQRSESVVHKGKALFLSAIVLFILCVIEGSIVLTLQSSLALPLFYPYFIWAVGLSVLLVTGLAFANHYGERALRQTGNTLLNYSVTFILLTIATLVLALAIKVDLTNMSELATFVIIPIVFFLNIVFFAIAYVLQIKGFKRK